MKKLYNIWIALLIGFILVAVVRYINAQADAVEDKTPLENAAIPGGTLRTMDVRQGDPFYVDVGGPRFLL